MKEVLGSSLYVVSNSNFTPGKKIFF